MIKSPKTVIIPLPKDEIAEIIFQLDTAYAIAENVAALYDKGLVLRAAGQLEEALDIFKALFRNKLCSLVTLANAYEQSALCLKEMSARAWRQKVSMNFKVYLKKAIEIQYILIAKQQSLKNCWVSFPTPKVLLEENPSSKSNIKELGNIHRMFNDYRGAIGLFKQVLDMETDECGKASVHMDIVQNCLKASKFDDAILHLNMVRSMPDSGIVIDKICILRLPLMGHCNHFQLEKKKYPVCD